jgi:outer membrane protein
VSAVSALALFAAGWVHARGSSSGPASQPASAAASAPTVTAIPPASQLVFGGVTSGLPLLTLDNAISQALQHQPALLQTQSAEKQTEAREGEAAAPLLPLVVAQGQVSYQNPIFPGIIPGSTLSGVPGLSVSQTLFDYGSYYRWRSAQAAVSSSQSAVAAAAAQLTLGVRVAYFGVLAAEAMVAVSGEQVDSQQRHLDQIRNYVEVGQRPKVDLVTATVSLDNVKVTLLQAQDGVQQAKLALQVAMGLHGAPTFEVQATELPPVPGEDGSSDTLLADALRQRPDVRQLDQQIDAQTLVVKAAHGSVYLPTLRVQGSYGYLLERLSETTTLQTCPTGDVTVAGGGGLLSVGGVPPTCVHGTNATGAFVFDPANPPFSVNGSATVHGNEWSASAILSWPLYAGGANKSQEDEQQATLGILQEQREQLVLSVGSDIESALLAIATDKAQAQVAAEATDQAQQQLDLTQTRYDAGIAGIVDLNDANVAVANANAQLIRTKYALAVDRAKLAKALGL